MNHDAIHDLRDALLRRALTAEEQRRLEAWLNRHPDEAAAWNEDDALALALRRQRLNTPAVPESFTAQVMTEIRRDHAPAPAPSPALEPEPVRTLGSASPGWWNLWTRWVSLAAAALVLFSAIGLWDRHHARADAEFARQVSALRFIADLPAGLLQDYDAIQRFGESAPPVDYELLAALQ